MFYFYFLFFYVFFFFFFFSSRRRHTRSKRDWSSDVCSSDLTRCRRWPRPSGRGIGAEARSNLRNAQAAEDRRPILLDDIAASGETKPHPVTTKRIPRGLLGRGEIAVCQAFGK